jgi:hypothetical protein
LLVLLLVLLVCWQRLLADAPMLCTVGIEVGLGLKPLMYFFDSHPHKIVDITTIEQKRVYKKP